MKKLNTLMLSCVAVGPLFLNSCAVVAVGAAAGAAGTGAAVATDPRSSGSVVDDNTIATKLQLNLSNNFPDSNISTTSYDGVVLLTGQIAKESQRVDIEFTVKTTPGVKKLYDYLEVRLPQSIGTTSSDTYITTQVKTKLLTTSGVSSNDIKVVTTNSIVYLLGVVNVKQAQLAAKAAASIDGVTKVVTLFEYING